LLYSRGQGSQGRRQKKEEKRVKENAILSEKLSENLKTGE
jgi:hypothetical protein